MPLASVERNQICVWERKGMQTQFPPDGRVHEQKEPAPVTTQGEPLP